MNPIEAIQEQVLTENWGRYRLFGLTLASNYSFEGRLLPGEDKADLFFACQSHKPVPGAWEKTPPTYISPLLNRDGDNILRFYSMDEYRVMHYPGVADFYLCEQGVVCHLLDPTQQEMATIHILPAVISVWLELNQELLALHASAVVVDGGAIGFLGHSGHGKSTLAAAFTQAGYPLLTDDILLVGEKDGEYIARPGYPSMRLWMDEAKLFLEHPEELEIIQAGYDKRRVPVGDENFGRFSDQIAPLACIYLPQRQLKSDGHNDILIEAIPQRDAVIEIIRFSYSSRLNEALGRNAQRLGFIARMAEALQLRRLAYPSEHAYLPSVRSALLKNLEPRILLDGSS